MELISNSSKLLIIINLTSFNCKWIQFRTQQFIQGFLSVIVIHSSVFFSFSEDTSVANVAACGDVRTKVTQPELLKDILNSEVEDFESWNEEAEFLELESDGVSVTKEDVTLEHSNYTTAEFDEAIFEDNMNKEESIGISKQSEKDVDSMNDEYFENTGFFEDENKFFDTAQEGTGEKVSINYLYYLKFVGFEHTFSLLFADTNTGSLPRK